MLRKHIVVVGGGWGGLRVARKLSQLNYHQARITLISDSPNFRYSAALYRAATGFKVQEAILPINYLIQDLPQVEFVKAKAKSVSHQQKIITLDNGNIIHYDYAVLALGSVTSYFNIPGLSKYSFGIKSENQITHLKNHLHQSLITNHTLDKNYVIVGGGPTGVELAAALGSYLKKIAYKHGIKNHNIKIELIEATDRILPSLSVSASDKVAKRLNKLGVRILTNSKVSSENSDHILVNNKIISSKTVIWTAGVASNPFYKNNASQFMLNNKFQVLVDSHLRSDKHMYVIGDNAVTPYTGLGLTAVHNANYVANEIASIIKNGSSAHLATYKPLVPAIIVPVGNKWALFSYKNITIGGLFCSILRSLADYIAYRDIAGTYKGFKIWLKSGEQEEVCTICKSTITTRQSCLAWHDI